MQKRDNGTGTIYRRENGSWVGKIYIGLKPDGKPRFKFFSGKTQTEVKRKIREFNFKGSTTERAQITVSEYLTRWLKTYKLGMVKESSYDALERTINNQITPYIGMMQLSQLTSDDIQDMLRKLKNNDGYSYSTVKKTYDCLHSALRNALINGDLDKDPMLSVKMPEKALFNTKSIKFFSEKECELIYEEARRVYKTGSPVYIYGDVYILMLNTGIRMGEAIGLRKCDWNQNEKTLHVQRNIQSVMRRNKDGERLSGKELVCSTTKTYSGDRIIPLNNKATEALCRLSERNPRSQYLVTSSNGNPIPPERLERTFYRILKNIGLEQTGTHSLRHTFASMLFAKGIDVKTVSKLLGHASIQITLDTYIHLIEGTDHNAVSKLDDIWK